MVKFFQFLADIFSTKSSNLDVSTQSKKSNKSSKSTKSDKSTKLIKSTNYDNYIFNNSSFNLDHNFDSSFNNKIYNPSTNLNKTISNNLSTNLDNLNNPMKTEKDGFNDDKSLFIVKKINNVLSRKDKSNCVNTENTIDGDFNLNNQLNRSYKIDPNDLDNLDFKFNNLHLSKDYNQLNKIVNTFNSVRIKNYSLEASNNDFKLNSLNKRETQWNQLNDKPFFDSLSIKSHSIESIEQSNLNQLINVDHNNIPYINDDIIEDDELANDLLNENIFELLKPDSCEEGICYYCKIDKHVIKCLDCGIWFCNGKGILNTSHIVHHLIRGKHNRVDFRLDRVKNKANCCNVCNNTNIFQLGYLSSNKNNRYLICRAPCKKMNVNDKKKIIETPIYENQDEYFRKLRKALPHLLINGETDLRVDNKGNKSVNLPRNTKQEIVNLMNWKPLIDLNKQFVNFVLSTPQNSEDKAQTKSINFDQITSLEDELEKYRNENLNKHGIKTSDLINQNSTKDKLTPVLLTYKDGTEYKDTFLKLIHLERKNTKSIDDDSIGSIVVYERTLKALNIFENSRNGINKIIYNCILGKNLPTTTIENDDCLSFDELYIDLEAPNLPEINESQRKAIVYALNNPLTLIQGPPGTGKTLTAAVLVYNLIKTSNSRRRKVIVCAPSNVACDHLADKISKTNLKVVRVLSKMKENDPTYHSPLSIHHKVKRPPIGSELYGFIQVMSQRVASKNDQERLTQLQLKYARELIKEADVVCVTCCTSMDKRLRYAYFDYLLIDEVCQATEPECIIPLSIGIDKLIMIGDQKQLAPVIKTSECLNAGFDQSLFQRLLVLGVKSFMLDHQYRMHPFISYYPRHQYYDGLLKDGISVKDRKLSSYKFPIPERPIFFYCCKDEEQTSVNGCSYLNQKECNYIGKILVKLARNGIQPSQIGIITPYEGQRSHLRNNLKFFGDNINYDEIEIESINAYQGREKDIIILSTVRSNYKQGKRSIGFLSDQRRLNVALTRAKYGLIIVGDPTTLCKHPTWYNLIKFYQDNNLLMTGEISNLKMETKIRLKQPNFDNDDDSNLKSNYHIRVERYDEIQNKVVEEFVRVDSNA